MAKKKNNKITRSVRYLAMEILDAIENEGAYSNILLNATIEKTNLIPQDKNLLTELVYGVTQRRLTLDYGLSPFVRTPKKMQSWVLNLLRLSVYQMAYLDKIPDHAIINEAAEIAKHKGHPGIVKLVNGILRNVQRNGLKNPADISDPIERTSVVNSVPIWLVKLFEKEIGLEKANALFESLLEKPYLSLRVQEADQVQEVKAKLEEEGILTSLSPLSPVGLRVEAGKVSDSESFKTGKVTIQDESSQLVALLGDLSKSDIVLDACAARGGKAMLMASYLDGTEGGLVHALDIHEHKIALIEQNATRMQATDRVKTHHLDAKEVLGAFPPESFDAIFVDAPCSGLGLMRRKPEIKYEVEAAAIDALHKEQAQILKAVEPLLKKNGKLIYSTCTLVERENQQTVAAFLENHSNMTHLSVETIINNEKINIPQEAITSYGDIQIFPNIFGTDGFFISVMEKVR